MNKVKEINNIIGVKESYQAPDKLLEKLLDVKEREKMFKAFLELFNYNVDYDWFHEYFQDEHADRKNKKQDFTPNEISDLMSKIVGGKGSYEVASGTGGMMIRKWVHDRNNSNFFTYSPSDYYYVNEELSDRALPFILFNMLIRGMNGEVRHIDTLTRECKGVFFIQNIENEYTSYSQLNIMPYNESVEEYCNVKFGDFRYKEHIETSKEESFNFIGKLYNIQEVER